MPKYSARKFVEAIPGTGGIISDIADKVGCKWHTAKKYIDEYQTVKDAYDEELARVNDIAKNNIITAIKRKDLQTSKWWLQVKDKDFMPKSAHELTGAEGNELKIIVEYADSKNHAS